MNDRLEPPAFGGPFAQAANGGMKNLRESVGENRRLHAVTLPATRGKAVPTRKTSRSFHREKEGKGLR
jgi:hypothetical protein